MSQIVCGRYVLLTYCILLFFQIQIKPAKTCQDNIDDKENEYVLPHFPTPLITQLGKVK